MRDLPEKQFALDQSISKPAYVTGSKTVVQRRDWSGEIRIRTQVDTTVGTTPPDQSGDRVSKILSDRGARKIADACAYMAAKHGGFKTFITGTFSEKVRADLTNYDIKTAKPYTTIQKEVTRTMDAMQKAFQRGWVDETTGEHVPGHAQPLTYCWVVEIPESENGEKNPHVHILMDWQVEYQNFKSWSARLESQWGNGYFHLEKINDPLCAGAYMAKAAGYISKGNGQSDQGEVTGNRYGISKRARAPEWYTIGEYELGVMGSIIRDLFDAVNAKHGHKFAERKRLNTERDNLLKLAKQEKEKTGKYPLWAKRKRQEIGKKLTAVRKEINDLPVRASKYQTVLKENWFPWFMGRALATVLET